MVNLPGKYESNNAPFRWLPANPPSVLSQETWLHGIVICPAQRTKEVLLVYWLLGQEWRRMAQTNIWWAPCVCRVSMTNDKYGLVWTPYIMWSFLFGLATFRTDRCLHFTEDIDWYSGCLPCVNLANTRLDPYRLYRRSYWCKISRLKMKTSHSISFRWKRSWTMSPQLLTISLFTFDSRE